MVADGRTDVFPLPAEPYPTGPVPVGERLRQAREARRMSLEDVATQTRIPLRHLEAIERSEWDTLPAATYSIGFAKSYADAVGLDRKEIGDDLKIELGGAAAHGVAETFQPADPARVPPRTLAYVALALAVLLLAGYGYYRAYALGDVEPQIVQPETPGLTSAPGPGGNAAQPPPTAAASGPVVITASEAVWIKVYERGGKTINETTLGAGQSYQVPAGAADPLLRTGRAELLRVSVGTADAPALGPPNTLIKDVSLKPAALMARAPAAPLRR